MMVLMVLINMEGEHMEKWLCGGVTYEKLREWAL